MVADFAPGVPEDMEEMVGAVVSPVAVAKESAAEVAVLGGIEGSEERTL